MKFVAGCPNLLYVHWVTFVQILKPSIAMPEFRVPRIPAAAICVAFLAASLAVGSVTVSYANSGASFGGGSFGEGGATSTPAASGASHSSEDSPTYDVDPAKTNDSADTSRAASNDENDAKDDDATSGGGGIGPVLIFGGFFGLIGLGIWAGKRAGHPYRISVLRFGVDGALTDLRSRLEGLAKTTDMSTFEGRSAALGSICVELQRNANSVFFADTQASAQTSSSAAEQQFQQRAMEARSKFDRETLRADSSGIREQKRNVALDGDLLDEDGDFLMNEILVLTLVLATKGDVTYPEVLENHQHLNDALLALGSTPATSLIALEVVWSPSADSDTMTVDEMQITYPRLMRL